ncbi:MAG TPA: PIN domain-containing protein [Casimicrobiaceae bacterium]
MTSIRIAELAYGAEIAANESERQRRHAALRRLKGKPLLCIDGDTGEIFGSLVAALRRSGRGAPRHRTQDVWLAAQAIQFGLCLLTYDRKDFVDIPGLTMRVLSH